MATLEALNKSKLGYLNLNQTGETRFFLKDPGCCSEVASSQVYDFAFPDRQFTDGLCRSGDENVILHIVCVCVEWKKLW
ncbi:hypothetical protein AM228_08785 [Planktothricoides sp. SR001]|nr:hypothetical protein AM228_08785 [Planktothricoides sp. SR001]